jgi:hypothetical protein
MLKKLLGIIFILCSYLNFQIGVAQNNNLDDKDNLSSLNKKVAQITSGSSGAEDKFNKIAQWICQNKKFDVKGFENFRMNSNPVEKLLNQKELLPGEYSSLLTAMCTQAGILCYSVEGYSRYGWYYPNKKYYYADYSWNVVNFNGNYSIVDITNASRYPVQGKKFNPYFLNIPADSAINQLMPYAPMWQLKENPVTIGSFEKRIINPQLQDTVLTISYKDLISNYEGKEKKDQYLLLAKEGFAFNSKNNLNTGINYLSCSQIYYNELINTVDSLKNERKSKIKELTGYANKATMHIERFLTDNNNSHTKCIDSLSRKSREIDAFVKKNKNEAQSVITTLSRKEYLNNNEIIKNDGIISKKEIEQLTKSNQKVLLNIRKSMTKSSFKDSSDFWMEEFQKNVDRINHERSLFVEIDSNIYKFENERTVMWDSALQIFNLKLLTVANACDEDLKSNNILNLRDLHKTYNSYNAKQVAMEKELNLKEREYKTQMLKRIDSLNRVITILTNHNKRLLFKVKRFSPVDSIYKVDSLYERQNDFAEECHKRSIDNYERWGLYLKLWNIEFKARKNIAVQISAFSDKYNKVEKTCYNKHVEIESLRYKKFNDYGSSLQKQCEELKEKINLFNKPKPK